MTWDLNLRVANTKNWSGRCVGEVQRWLPGSPPGPPMLVPEPYRVCRVTSGNLPLLSHGLILPKFVNGHPERRSSLISLEPC